jgi:MarR family transcriptional regulator, organic hydroperoxide resistance regulator
MRAEAVAAVLRCYPQIFLACHVTHPRAASSPSGLSDRDSMVLGHLSEEEPVRAAWLARHLGIRPSSLSAILNRLVEQGLIARREHAEDRRVAEIRLTAKGSAAMQQSSVLDGERVGRMLELLSAGEREAALHGLALLARAARQLSAQEGQTAWSRRDA